MITPCSGKAVYLVIADKIIDDILAGRLKPDDRLLSIRDYAVETEVNHNTVKRSYDYLSALELIYNRRGVGFFVADDALEKGKKLRSRQLLGHELDKIFSQLHLLEITPQELMEKYSNYIAEKAENR